MSRNEITGDKLVSKISNKNWEDGYDRIFPKEKKETHVKDIRYTGCTGKAGVGCDPSCSSREVCGREEA
jgi:hypothetical protein